MNAKVTPFGAPIRALSHRASRRAAFGLIGKFLEPRFAEAARCSRDQQCPDCHACKNGRCEPSSGKNPCPDGVCIKGKCRRAGAGATGAIERVADEFYTVLYANHGDRITFRLRNGQTRSIVLEDSGLDRYNDFGVDQWTLWMEVTVDSHPHRVLYTPFSMKSLYEPTTIDGMRIGLDVIKDLPTSIDQPGEGPQVNISPHDVRLWLNDATMPLLPNAYEWFQLFQDRPNDSHVGGAGRTSWPVRADYRIRWDRDVRYDTRRLDVMGNKSGYLGNASYGIHTGADMTVPNGTPLYGVVDGGRVLPDTKGKGRFYYRVERPNGDAWDFGSHHSAEHVVPIGGRVDSGTVWARSGYTGTSAKDAHAHCALLLAEKATGVQFGLNPWPAMWQGLENRKARDNVIRAAIEPVGPAPVGQAMAFSSRGSRPGPAGGTLSYAWYFSDGTTSTAANPRKTFAKPGMHQAILVVNDGRLQALREVFFTVGTGGDEAPTIDLEAWVAPSLPKVGSAADFGVKATGRNNHPVEFTWNFGDRSTASGRTPKHAFSQPGRYAVVVTARDTVTNARRLDYVLVDTYEWPQAAAAR